MRLKLVLAGILGVFGLICWESWSAPEHRPAPCDSLLEDEETIYRKRAELDERARRWLPFSAKLSNTVRRVWDGELSLDQGMAIIHTAAQDNPEFLAILGKRYPEKSERERILTTLLLHLEAATMASEDQDAASERLAELMCEAHSRQLTH